MQSQARKQKRDAEKAIKETDILCVKRKGFIGSMYVNGVTLHLTNTHAVLSRAYTHNVFQVGSVNYSMLKYIYDLNAKTDRTKEEDDILQNAKAFVLSFTINDFAGNQEQIQFNFKLYELYLMKVTHAAKEEVESFTENLMAFFNQNNEAEVLDQSDLESEEVENANNVDLNHVRSGFNMVDALEANKPSEEPK